MNARTILTAIVLFVVVFTAACAPAASPTREALQPQVNESRPLPTAPAYKEEYAAPPVEAPSAGSVEQPMVYPTPAPTQSNQFEDYGVNPYTDTRADHLSTFAVDVDTASYTVMRAYLNDGNLPPADSVRVEEFINYFEQDYPSPTETSFAIYTDGAPSPFNPEGYLVRVGLQGYRVPEWARKPLALTFVIDVSGSMGMGSRLELVKESLEMLVDRLDSGDSVAIVVYGSNARIVLKPTPGNKKNVILKAIYSLEPEGSTNLEAGLQLGYEQAMKAYNGDGLNRIVLCSDGVANVGNTEADSILRSVRGYVQEGIFLTTIGFGMGNFNDVLMEQLANDGNGNYAYVDDRAEAEKLFVDDLTSTLQTIAIDAKVQVDFNPDVVAAYRLMGYENRAVADQDFRNDRVDAGEIGAGHSVTALYEVTLKGRAEGRIATVQMRWQDPETYQVYEINQNFNTWEMAQSFEEASPRFRLTALVGLYAEVLRQSPWMAHVRMNDLLEYAYDLPRQLNRDADVVEFVDLLEKAARLMR